MSRARRRRAVTFLVSTLLTSPHLASAQQPAPAALDRSVLPIEPAPFTGLITETAATSKPSYPARLTAPNGAPNILVIMTDDVGFGASSTFGGPIPTPNLDRLAARGLRYNNFHTTAICSPSRAALLTGRNPHRVGSGHLIDIPAGFPGYTTAIPRNAASIGKVLGGNGYSTAFFGKHHNVPIGESGGVGPFDRWPTGLGFDYFFGLIGWGTDQWHPTLYRNTSRVQDPPGSDGDLLDKRLADDALSWIHNQKAAAPDKPFLIYYAPASTHSPHQAPGDWIARFRGKFDQGWDQLRAETFARQRAGGVVPTNTELTARPPQIPAWDTQSPAMKRVHARSMEVYAAQLAYQDAQIGRILDELERMRVIDDTLIMFVEGDNGASAEAGLGPTYNELGESANRLKETDAQLIAMMDENGGPRTTSNYAVGWTWAMNTPFRWFKQVASHEGGTHTAMVVSWPKRITARGELRSQFTYLTDIAPTLFEAAMIPEPKRVDGVEQQRLDGVSLLPTFTSASADNHRTQYFEIGGNIAIYHDGWMASSGPRSLPWDPRPLDPAGTPHRWELYNLRQDFSQSRDLAASNPAKLQEMLAIWDREAKRNQVYPIDERALNLRGMVGYSMRPNVARTSFTYWGNDVSVPQDAAPNFTARSFSVTADINVAKADMSGVLLATGSWFGGWSFYLKNGRPVITQAVSQYPEDQFRVAGSRPVPRGDSKVKFIFTSDGGAYAGGEMEIFINDQSVAKGRIAKTLALAGTVGEALDIGRDTNVPVTSDYAQNVFPGLIRRVDVNLGPASLYPSAGNKK